MILVDTSTLIDFFKNRDTIQVDKFKNIISLNIPFGINKYIYQEILQGSKNENEFNILDKYLSSQIFYEMGNDINSFRNSALLFFKCRKNGFTVKTIDCLIANTTIENNLLLLHNDKDFEDIQKIDSRLKFY